MDRKRDAEGKSDSAAASSKRRTVEASCGFPGCTWTGPRDQMRSHREACPRQPTTVQVSLSDKMELKDLAFVYDKLRSFTDSKLRTKPVDATDPALIPHILQAAFPNHIVLLCDGSNSGSKNPAQNPLYKIHDLPVGNVAKLEIKLSDPPQMLSAYSCSEIINNEKLRSRFEEWLKDQVANALGLNQTQITITDLKEGSIVAALTINDMSPRQVASLLGEDRLHAMIENYVSMEVHPAAMVLQFDLDDFDKAGNKDFSRENSKFDVGPPGNTRPYQQPHGWTRIGLKVLPTNTFGADHSWLHPFQHHGNWWRGFHGLRKPAVSASPIVHGGFEISVNGVLVGGVIPGTAVHGDGVYTSPFILTSEGYCHEKVQVEMRNGTTKHFKVAFQVAVKPDRVNTVAANGAIWVVGHRDDVRPYGLLFKEA